MVIKMMKKTLAVIMTMAILLSCVCTTAFADGAKSFNTVFDFDNFGTTNSAFTESGAKISWDADTNQSIMWGDGYEWQYSKIANNKTESANKYILMHDYLIMSSDWKDFHSLNLVHEDAPTMGLKSVTVKGRAAKEATEVFRIAVSSDEKSYYEFGRAGLWVSGNELNPTNDNVPGLSKLSPYFAVVQDGVRTVIKTDTSVQFNQWNGTEYNVTISDEGVITFTATNAEGKTFTGTANDADYGLLDSFAYPMAITSCGNGSHMETQWLEAGITYDYREATGEIPGETPEFIDGANSFDSAFAFANFGTTNSAFTAAGSTIAWDKNATQTVMWGDGFEWQYSKYSTDTHDSTDKFIKLDSYLIMKSNWKAFYALNLAHDEAPIMDLKSVTVKGRAAKESTEVVRIAVSADEKSFYEFGRVGRYIDGYDLDSSSYGGFSKLSPYFAVVQDGVRTVIKTDTSIQFNQWNNTEYNVKISDEGVIKFTATNAEGKTFTGTVDDANYGLLDSFAYPMALTSCGDGDHRETQWLEAGITYDYCAKSKIFNENWTAYSVDTVGTNCINFFGNANTKDNEEGTALPFAWGDNYSWEISAKTHLNSNGVYTGETVSYWNPPRLVLKDNVARGNDGDDKTFENEKETIVNLVHDDSDYMDLEEVKVNSLYSNNHHQMVRIAVDSQEDTYYELGVGGDYTSYYPEYSAGDATLKIYRHRPYVARVVDGVRTVLAVATNGEFNKWARNHYSITIDGSSITFNASQTNNGSNTAGAGTLTFTVDDSSYGILNKFAYPLALAGEGANGSGEMQFEGLSVKYSKKIECIDLGNMTKVAVDTSKFGFTNTANFILATYTTVNGAPKLEDKVQIIQNVTGFKVINIGKPAISGAYNKLFFIDGSINNLTPAAPALRLTN